MIIASHFDSDPFYDAAVFFIMIASIELNDTAGMYAEYLGQKTCIGGCLYDMEDEQLADYLVYRVEGSGEQAKIAIQFDFVFKEWNEETESDEGAIVSLVFSKREGGFGFQLIDGNANLLPAESVVKAYSVDDIKNWVPMQQLVQTASQFILNNDERILELLKN